MNIKYTNYSNETKEIELSELVADEIKCNYADGELESIKANVNKSAQITANLVNLLADKKILSAADVAKILGKDKSQIKFMKA
jgi:hypothetical protein